MAVQKFRRRVDHHVRAQSEGLLKVWGHERVVDNQFDFFRAADARDGFQVGQRHQGIGRSFHIDHARVFSQRALDVLGIRSVDVGEFEAVAGEDLIEQSRNAAVKIVSADHVIAGFEHGADGIDCRHAAAEDARGDAAFERSQIRFQAIARRVGGTRVVVADVLAQFFLNIGGCRVNWSGYRAS